MLWLPWPRRVSPAGQTRPRHRPTPGFSGTRTGPDTAAWSRGWKRTVVLSPRECRWEVRSPRPVGASLPFPLSATPLAPWRASLAPMVPTVALLFSAVSCAAAGTSRGRPRGRFGCCSALSAGALRRRPGPTGALWSAPARRGAIPRREHGPAPGRPARLAPAALLSECEGPHPSCRKPPGGGAWIWKSGTAVRKLFWDEG